MESISELVRRARAAQAEFEKTATQESVDAIVKALAKTIYENAEPLAKLAAEESGMGLYEDKINKNKGKARIIWNFLKDKKSVGVISRDDRTCITEVARPMGVVAAITPCTNPIVTPMCNAMYAIKGRNAIILAPHPRAKKCAKVVTDLFRREIEALAAKSNYPEYGISGRCNYITEKGVTGVGLSGNKAQHLDLTVELGFSSDMGVTNSRYPEEICEGQAQINQGSMMGLSYDQLDISTADMEDVDLYMQSLGVPARRNINDPQVILGEQKFYEAKCHLCHVTTLHTQAGGSTLLNGTRLPWLGGQTIHPYSDFLLHDMGSEIMGVGLNDNYVSGLARGNEWRTTPLWGIGLQEKVNGHTYFLHDGRARNLTEAIMWHGGEGEASKNLFKQMSKEEREAVIAFLNSL